MKKPCLTTMMATVLTVGLVHASPVPVVDPNVVSIRTLGRWTSAGTTGQYRVIVTTDGWEHVWSHVFVEWLPDPTSPDVEPVPAAIAELRPPEFSEGTLLMDAVAEERSPGHLLVTVRATPNQDLREFGVRKTTYRFLATTPGAINFLHAAPK